MSFDTFIDPVVLTVIGLIGLGLLLLFAMFDDLFDLFGGEPVLPAAAFFTAMFGFSGAIGALNGGTLQSAVLIPLAIGVASATVFFIAYRKLKKVADKDESFVADPETMLDATATVVWWSNGSGEVMVSYLGQPRKVMATSDEDLSSAQSVFVTEVISASQIKVSATRSK